MGFLSARGGSESAADSESLARIEAGGIPLAAERRLRELGREGSLFASGLSVNEFALLRQMGPQPLAQVLGASVHQVGWQYLPALDPTMVPTRGNQYGPAGAVVTPQQRRKYRWDETVVCELGTITQAWDQARRRALDRLSEEALQVGADAVVGVHLSRGEHDWSKGTIDYLISGTAIRSPGLHESSWPVLSDLSVQDYWRLSEAGHEPVGLIATTMVVFVSASGSTRVRRLRTVTANQELEELGRGFFAARDTVRARLRGQVDAHGGDGAVGVQLSHTVHEETFALESSLGQTRRPGWYRGMLGLPFKVTGASDMERKGWVITMHGAGTAIRRREATPRYPPETIMRAGRR